MDSPRWVATLPTAHAPMTASANQTSFARAEPFISDLPVVVRRQRRSRLQQVVLRRLFYTLAVEAGNHSSPAMARRAARGGPRGYEWYNRRLSQKSPMFPSNQDIESFDPDLWRALSGEARR